MDNICEQLVERRRTGGDNAKTALICAGLALAAAACVICAVYFGIMLLIAAAIIPIAAAVWVLMGVNVEYEYTVTNNELDIDKIIGRRTRKPMITVDLSAAEDFGTYPPKEESDAETTVQATSGLERDAHYLIVKHRDYGKVKVIFNPNEKLREAIAREFPKPLRARLQQYGK
ncbi:MAG: hypothetical protein K2J77_05130 [Oscillospiraceae bacterium]|nr:hypothetical protein [Oscillospiraceae bacterium]